MGARTITEETIGGLFNEGKLTPLEFGLRWVEVRQYGDCHPSELTPCKHDDETNTVTVSVYHVYGEQRLGQPWSEYTCPNVWATGGDVEGIGGEYVNGGTFSYLGDDRELCDRIYRRAAEVAD
ncbi:hypothetical protein [Micromonospora sp. NPDC047730]|uniref:hypothetical protein n=1 Tax=Micromonospora sp. NPDC047730 TaxID=3364253 RepID=UPI0037144554